jgi:hypothetical protein
MLTIGGMRSVLALLLLGSCATSGKAKLITVAFEDQGRRRDLFEATLRVLDRNPEWVDEFYALARSHRPTLEGFIENTARDLSNEKLATITARHLAAHPAGLRTILERSMDAASDHPAAKKAIAEAVRSRAEIAAKIMVDHPEALRAMTRALAEKATADENARQEIRKGLGDALNSK